jgi:hypothetical protein
MRDNSLSIREAIDATLFGLDIELDNSLLKNG